jgi:hypothetical protein
MSDAPAGLRLIKVTNGWAIGEYERCLAIVWRDQPSIETFRERNDHLVELAKTNPGRCALVEIIETTSKPPGDDARKAAMEVFRKLGGDLSGIGFVVEGTEMRTALLRAILTGMLFFLKQPQPTKVFKRAPEMAAWVRTRVQNDDPGFDQRLLAVLEHLRSLINKQSEGAAS